MRYREETTLEEFSKINTESWEDIKHEVFINLINRKFLSEYDKGICYTKMADLAMVYTIKERTRNAEDEVLYYYLTKNDIKRYGVTIDEVKKAALENSANNRKMRLVTLSESFAMRTMFYPVTVKPKDASISLGDKGESIGVLEDVKGDKENVLAVTNKVFPFGAAYMFLPSILGEVWERFNYENFYILPISRHQAWFIRSEYATKNGTKTKAIAEDDLLDMIEEFNDTQNKSWRDVLSYKIYYYMGDDGNVIVPIG